MWPEGRQTWQPAGSCFLAEVDVRLKIVIPLVHLACCYRKMEDLLTVTAANRSWYVHNVVLMSVLPTYWQTVLSAYPCTSTKQE